MCPSPTPDLEGAPAGSPGSAAVPQHPGIAAIRTLALAGPAGAGKTSLAEALLLKAGAIKSAGSIEKGSTVSDHDPLEKRMQHSLQAAQMHLLHNGLRVHLLDTPGAPDFIGQALPALEAFQELFGRTPWQFSHKAILAAASAARVRLYGLFTDF